MSYDEQEIKKFLLREGFQEVECGTILNHWDETERVDMLTLLDSCIVSVDASIRTVGEDGQRFPLPSFKELAKNFLEKIKLQQQNIKKEPKNGEEPKKEENPKNETVPRGSWERFIVETAFTIWCGFIGFVIGTIILPGHGSVFGTGLFIFLSHQIRLKNR